MMWPPEGMPTTWPVYGIGTRPHWAAMTEQGGPTWGEDEGIRRWRERAFPKRPSHYQFAEDGEMEANQARMGWEG